MSSFFDKVFGRKKSLPQMIEDNFEDLIKRSIHSSKDLDSMIQGTIVLSAIAEGTVLYKEAYNETFKEMGYNKLEYEKLVDQICSKVINKYIY